MLISPLDLIYNLPFCTSPGTIWPDKKGFVNSRLNGSVHYASSNSFKITNGRKQCIKDSYLCAFGIDGRILYKNDCDKYGVLKRITTYYFNESNQVIEIVSIDSRGKLTSRYTFDYNEKQLLCSYKWFGENDKYCGQHIYLYDTNDNIKEDSWDSVTPMNRWKRIYAYDNKNQEIEMREYKGAENRYIRKNIKTYDIFGNVIKHEYIGADGNVEDLDVCKFDELGRCIAFNPDLHHPNSIKYDHTNRISEIIPDEKLVIKVLYNESKSITFLWMERDSLVISKKREICFDEHENIISIINYKGENLNDIEGTLYSYEYYPM